MVRGGLAALVVGLALPAGAERPTIVNVVAGFTHSCALDALGHVWCWGRNNQGQLGDGTTTDRLTPQQVPGLGDVAEVALGTWHSCARQISGQVRCWGWNETGQLGDGGFTRRTTPVRVKGLNNVAGLSLGGSHSCARLENGRVRCWGKNWEGQVGDGTISNNRPSPVPVPGLRNVVEIALGRAHSCARLANSRVRCWGYNFYGQLGDGTNINRSSPVVVSGLGNAAEIKLGGWHSCVRQINGNMRCWGNNQDGNLGDGTLLPSLTQIRVPGLRNVAGISLGGTHSCARLQNGRLRCWGYNEFGQVGGGSDDSRQLSPVPLPRPRNVADVSLGFWHSCAVQNNGRVSCWGLNSFGQLGDGTTTQRRTPVEVTFSAY